MDIEMMKKEAAKEALEDLVKQLLGIEGKMIKDGESEECSEMPESLSEVLEASKDSGTEMSEDELEEKKAYMTGAKKPIMKKSMMVVMKSPSSSSLQEPKSAMASIFKKKPKYG